MYNLYEHSNCYLPFYLAFVFVFAFAFTFKSDPHSECLAITAQYVLYMYITGDNCSVVRTWCGQCESLWWHNTPVKCVYVRTIEMDNWCTMWSTKSSSCPSIHQAFSLPTGGSGWNPKRKGESTRRVNCQPNLAEESLVRFTGARRTLKRLEEQQEHPELYKTGAND